MAKLQWAKFPTQWLKPSTSSDDEEQHFPLTELTWSRYAGTAIAAVLVLIALSIRLNQSHKGKAFEGGAVRSNSVAVTFEDLRQMTGLAKASISGALMLLEGFAAIQTQRSGRANAYKLVGLEQDGGWCQLPQGWLLKPDGTFKLKQIPRNRLALNALKVYLLLMHLRNNKLNTTAVSFTTITRWTGVRREDLPNALGTLSMMHLARISFDRDIRHRKGDNSHRYSVLGLGDAQGLYYDEDMITSEGSFFMSPTEIYMNDEPDTRQSAVPALPAAESQRPVLFVVPNPSVLGVPPPWKPPRS
jgi:hypothetical protein